MVIESFYYFESLIYYFDKLYFNFKAVANKRIELKRFGEPTQTYKLTKWN